MDLQTSLCLACSSSLPPNLKQLDSHELFTTPCCIRPICPTCLASNPRLARYNPCLACLGGVAAVQSSQKPLTKTNILTPPTNIDGGVRDEDTYVIGDDEDDAVNSDDTLPPYLSQPLEGLQQKESAGQQSGSSNEPASSGDSKVEESGSAPSKYYIQRGDTLQGIALRFGVKGRELCTLNKLPPSTLSTTPHILHTRTWLELPHTARHGQGHGHGRTQGNGDHDPEREARRARERAEKRLQTLTKEVDWRVAKAYVALANDPEDVENFGVKQKEMGGGDSKLRMKSCLEAVAVDRYLEDEGWEEDERRAGRGHDLMPFPYANGWNTASRKGKGVTPESSERSWWSWKS